jgi:hypothetical protein
MLGHGEKQERLLELAIAALLTESTVEAAAAKAGVSYATLKGWLRRDEAFREEYAAARREILQGTVSRLLAASTRAVDTLVGLLDCDRPATRARAAVAVLDFTIRGTDTLDLAEQVADLKKRVEGLHGDRSQA